MDSVLDANVVSTAVLQLDWPILQILLHTAYKNLGSLFRYSGGILSRNLLAAKPSTTTTIEDIQYPIILPMKKNIVY